MLGKSARQRAESDVTDIKIKASRRLLSAPCGHDVESLEEETYKSKESSGEMHTPCLKTQQQASVRFPRVTCDRAHEQSAELVRQAARRMS